MYCKTSANNKFAWQLFEQWLEKKYHLLHNFIKLQMAIQTNGNSDNLLRTSVPAMDIGSNQCQTSAMTKCKWKLQFHWEKTTRTELRNQKSYCVTRFVSESVFCLHAKTLIWLHNCFHWAKVMITEAMAEAYFNFWDESGNFVLSISCVETRTRISFFQSHASLREQELFMLRIEIKTILARMFPNWNG